MTFHPFLVFASLLTALIGCTPLGTKKGGALEPRGPAAEATHATFSLNGGAQWPAFGVELSCRMACATGAAKSIATRATFDPDRELLKTGNGNLLTPFTATLGIWGEGVCLAAAAASCGDAAAVKEATLLTMRSGKWETRFPITCAKDQARVLSPWDAQFKADLLAPLAEDEHRRLADPVALLKAGGLKEPGCAHVLKGKLCFGDCMDIEAPSGSCPLCLATSAPQGTGDFEVCADRLVEELRVKKGEAWKHWACERFFWKSMRESGSMAAACAAIRGESGCGELLKTGF